MYAIVKTGGKQYRVEKGQTLLVEKLPEEEGAKVALQPLLYRSDDAVFDGADLEKVRVEATILEQLRGPKIRVFKFKPKRGYKRTTGHRQSLTRIEVTDIKMLSRKPAAPPRRQRQRQRQKLPPPPPLPAEKPAAPKKPAPQPAQARCQEGGRGWLIRRDWVRAATAATPTRKRLGVKVFAGETVTGGEIIVRQRGTRFHPGDGVGIGKDDTIYARQAGTVVFKAGRRGRVISIEPGAES